MIDEERIVYAPRLSWLNDIWQRALNAYLLTAPVLVAFAWRISCL